MKTLIIGSGLIGLTSAYCLSRRGHAVTVIDRQEGPGRETSFANGALLHSSMAEPWNAPGCWRVLLSSIGCSGAALQLRLKALPGLAPWGLRFLRNSSPERFEANTLSNLRLASYSLRMMHSLREQTGIEYGQAARGTLRLFRDIAALDRACAVAERRSSDGLRFQRLSNVDVANLEPALASIASQLAGGIHYVCDEIGNAYRFCLALCEQARRTGVTFQFGREVTRLELKSGQLAAVTSDEQRFTADRYVVAAGSYSTPLLRSIGIHVPVEPVKGYSVTYDCGRSQATLQTPIIDDALHVAVVPLEGAIRVAGTAEFAGFDRHLNPGRVSHLKGLLKRILPDTQLDDASAKAWCGLRPMSADGVPYVGSTPVPSLFINTGHGHLGWTMAAGSAQLLADLMDRCPPALEASAYSLTRRFDAHAGTRSPASRTS